MEKNKYDPDADTAQRILATRRALQEKRLHVAPHLQALVDELLAAPMTMSGLVDIKKLSAKAIAFGRMGAMGLSVMQDKEKENQSPSRPMGDIQFELFELFSRLFGALTGRAYELIRDDEEIQRRMIDLVRHEPEAFERRSNEVIEELAEFYKVNAPAIFQYAKQLGGMRIVTGGQRTFGPSALNAVRLTGLYADTQLIPDPIYPFFSADLHLNARHLQLAINLLHILQLRPLVNLQLPVPPVLVFPSFEEVLEKNDGYTIHSMEKLVIRMIAPLCKGTIESTEDLFDYANRNNDAFAQKLLDADLFIPPGESPGRRFGVEEAAQIYLEALKGFRDTTMLEQMRALPKGVLLLNGVIERLRPHYHLLENSGELGAQPLLSQPAHWHYFEKCAAANAEELRRREILSEQAFQTLRAVQDDSLSWLVNIPVEQLGHLIANNEHKWLREELDGYTKQLASTGAANANDMVREISHGLTSLVQRQQQAMREIEKKYEPAKKSAIFSAGAGLLVAGTAFFLPVLSPVLGIAIPAAGAIAAIGRGAIGLGQAAIGERTEKRHAEQSMLGILASIHPQR